MLLLRLVRQTHLIANDVTTCCGTVAEQTLADGGPLWQTDVSKEVTDRTTDTGVAVARFTEKRKKAGSLICGRDRRGLEKAEQLMRKKRMRLDEAVWKGDRAWERLDSV